MATKVDVPEGTCPPGKHHYMLWRTVFEIDTKYVPIKPIGKGAYGVVCSAKNNETGDRVAIKKITNAFENTTDARRTLREIRLLRHLFHENIIAVKDIMKPVSRLAFNDVYIVYELMDTDLHQIIRSSQTLTDDHCQYFIYQVKRTQASSFCREIAGTLLTAASGLCSDILQIALHMTALFNLHPKIDNSVLMISAVAARPQVCTFCKCFASGSEAQ